MDEYEKDAGMIRQDAAKRYKLLNKNLDILAKIKPHDFLFVDSSERAEYIGIVLEPFGCAGYVTRPFSNDVTTVRGMHKKGIIVEFKKCELLFSNGSFRRFDRKVANSPRYPVYDDSRLHTRETAETALKKHDFSLDKILEDLE